MSEEEVVVGVLLQFLIKKLSGTTEQNLHPETDIKHDQPRPM